MSYGITYDVNANNINIDAYRDANSANDPVTRRSVTGWILFGNDGPTTWGSKKQTLFTTSTIKEEFVGLCNHKRNYLVSKFFKRITLSEK